MNKDVCFFSRLSRRERPLSLGIFPSSGGVSLLTPDPQTRGETLSTESWRFTDPTQPRSNASLKVYVCGWHLNVTFHQNWYKIMTYSSVNFVIWFTSHNVSLKPGVGSRIFDVPTQKPIKADFFSILSGSLFRLTSPNNCDLN